MRVRGRGVCLLLLRRHCAGATRCTAQSAAARAAMAQHRAIAWLLLGAAFLLARGAAVGPRARSWAAPRRRPPLRPSAARESGLRPARRGRHLEGRRRPATTARAAPSRAELARPASEPFNVWPEKGAAPRAADPCSSSRLRRGRVARKPCAPAANATASATRSSGAAIARRSWAALLASALPGVRRVARAARGGAGAVRDRHAVAAERAGELRLHSASASSSARWACYVTDPRNETMVKWVNSQRNLRGLAPNDEYWEASLRGAGERHECGGRGGAPRMPERGAGKGAPRCMPPGWSGRRCGRRRRSGRAHANGCSKRGKYVRGATAAPATTASTALSAPPPTAAPPCRCRRRSARRAPARRGFRVRAASSLQRGCTPARAVVAVRPVGRGRDHPPRAPVGVPRHRRVGPTSSSSRCGCLRRCGR